MFSVYLQLVHAQVLDHLTCKIAHDFVQMNCHVFLYKDAN